jgi:general secretion pathway protein K
MNHIRQRGVALISVLLVMTLALLVVGAMMRSHTLLLQSGTQQIHQVQLRQWALAGEDWARTLLTSPEMQQSKTIHLAQAWARPALTFELPAGDARVSIEDLAARFNITPLLQPGKADEIALRRWARLLETLELPPLDLAPLRGMDVSDISQLRLLPEVNLDRLERLRPWVVVLPSDAQLNVNTASTTLLSTLEGMSVSTALDHVAQRPPEGFADAQSFARSPWLDGLGIASQGLGVDSRWFRVSVEVEAGGSRLRMVTDFERLTKPYRLRVIQRRFLAPTESETQ